MNQIESGRSTPFVYKILNFPDKYQSTCTKYKFQILNHSILRVFSTPKWYC